MRRIAILCLVLAGGCGRSLSPSLLPDEVQGDWTFDEARFLDENKRKAQSPEEFAQFRDLYDTMKKIGAPMRTDIRIRGDRIVGQGALLQDQFDVLELRRDGDKLVCKVLWHEDRHDPGDCSEEDIVLVVRGDRLEFTLGGDLPEAVPFPFTRKK